MLAVEPSDISKLWLRRCSHTRTWVARASRLCYRCHKSGIDDGVALLLTKHTYRGPKAACHSSERIHLRGNGHADSRAMTRTCHMHVRGMSSQTKSLWEMYLVTQPLGKQTLISEAGLRLALYSVQARHRCQQATRSCHSLNNVVSMPSGKTYEGIHSNAWLFSMGFRHNLASCLFKTSMQWSIQID